MVRNIPVLSTWPIDGRIMKNHSSVLAILLLMCSVPALQAQQDPMYNQYIFNAYTINPAEAGIRAYGTASFLQRWQWLGVKGAPSTTSMGIESSYLSNWGFGLNVVNDKLGPEVNQTVNLSTGYHIRLTDKFNLAAGINGAINHRRLDANSFNNLWDPDDPDLISINTVRPNVGGGLLVYSEHAFIGLSMPRLMEYKSSGAGQNLALDQVRHLFLYTGRIFDVSEKLKVKPSLLMKVVSGAPVQFDVNGVVSLAGLIDAGFNYRLGDGIGLLFGITMRQRLILNYAYEIPLSAIRNSSKQTHEVGIRYRFGKAHVENVQSPRFFN